MPASTTYEIERISSYLKTLDREQLENFALDWLSSLNWEITRTNLQIYMENITWFWSPFMLEEAEGNVILVRNYTVHSMPSSGRCKLLNPFAERALHIQQDQTLAGFTLL